MDFNPTKSTIAERTQTENYEGGTAWEADTPELGLFIATTATLIESQFYRDETEQLDHLRDAVRKAADHDPEFAVQMAAYAREVMYLRDAPQVMLVDLAHHDKAKRYVRAYAPLIIQRADEPATILGVWNRLYNGADAGDPFPDDATLPKPLKKGINDALEQFDAYHFAKYDSSRRRYGIKDVFNLTHPKASSPERQVLHDRLMWGGLDSHPDVDPLPTPVTWETVISERGSNREAWADALPYMGMFARIRNIRNLLEVGIPGEDIVKTPMKGVGFDPDAPDGRGDEFTISEDGMTLDEVRRRKLYPFRFYRAFTAMQGQNLRSRWRAGNRTSYETLRLGEVPSGDLYDEAVAEFLSDAIDTAAETLPDRLGRTLVAVDLSGSMRHALSKNSTVSYKEIGALFGAALARKGATVFAYADEVAHIQVHHDSPTLQNMSAVMGADNEVGGSTYAWKVPAAMRAHDIDVDRLVFMTDEQAYDRPSVFRSESTVRDEWAKYRREINPEARVFTIDLAGYPTLQFPEGEAFYIGGWSEKVLDFIGYAEQPGDAIDDVRAIEPASPERLPGGAG